MKTVLIALLGLLLAAPMANATDNDHVYVVKKSGAVSSYTVPQGKLFFTDSDIFYFKLNTFEAKSESVLTGSFTVQINKDDIKSFASSIIEVGIAYSWFHNEPVYGLDAWMKLGDSLTSDAYTFNIQGLDHGVTYYIRPYVRVLGKVYHSNIIQSVKTQGADQTLNLVSDLFARNDDSTSDVDWVHVYMTKYNVGSCTEGNPGSYFAWGEMEPKDEYTWDNYKMSIGDSIINYVSDPDAHQLDPSDDVVRLAFGKDYQTTTMEAFVQLLFEANGYIHTWSSRVAPDGSTINGWQFQSAATTSSTETVFIPAAGYYDGTTLIGYNEQVLLWTNNTCNKYHPKDSFVFYGDKDGKLTTGSSKTRYMGMPVRSATIWYVRTGGDGGDDGGEPYDPD